MEVYKYTHARARTYAHTHTHARTHRHIYLWSLAFLSSVTYLIIFKVHPFFSWLIDGSTNLCIILLTYLFVNLLFPYILIHLYSFHLADNSGNWCLSKVLLRRHLVAKARSAACKGRNGKLRGMVCDSNPAQGALWRPKWEGGTSLTKPRRWALSGQYIEEESYQMGSLLFF